MTLDPRSLFNAFRTRFAALRRKVQFVWWHEKKLRFGFGKLYAGYADDVEKGRNPK